MSEIKELKDEQLTDANGGLPHKRGVKVTDVVEGRLYQDKDIPGKYARVAVFVGMSSANVVYDEGYMEEDGKVHEEKLFAGYCTLSIPYTNFVNSHYTENSLPNEYWIGRTK